MIKKKLRNRPKGLFLIHLPPPTHGVSVINQWIKESQKINESVVINSIDLATARTISDIGKQSISKYFKLIQIYFLTLYNLIFKSYDFVYITLSPIGSAFVKDSLLVLLARFLSIPVLIHLHGKGIAKKLNDNASKGLTRYYNYVFKNTYVIHLANTLIKDLSAINSYKELFVLNNGIPKFKIGEKIKTDKINILHLSNLIETKGSFILLKAVLELIKKGITNFQINYVGNWDNHLYKDKFYEYIKTNELEKYVNILGPLYGVDKLNILAKSDIFVLPTYYANECFPLTILEAMQAGLPIISSFEGAIPEMIEDGDNGFLVEAKNKIELANKLSLLIKSKSLREDMKQKALETYNSKYTFSIFEKKLIDIINKVTT